MTRSVQTECPMSGVKSRGLLERGKEKQEVVGELCLLVSSVETKPNTSLKSFLQMNIIIRQTLEDPLTCKIKVKVSRNRPRWSKGFRVG